MEVSTKRIFLSILLLAMAGGCQSVQLATQGEWTGCIVPVNLYDGHSTYRAAALKIVNGPEIPSVPVGFTSFRIITDQPLQYDSPLSLNPILTDQQNRPLDPSSVSSDELVHVDGWGGRGVISLSADQRKPLYVALYDPQPPRNSYSSIGQRISTTIQVTHMADNRKMEIKLARVTQPDTTSQTAPPTLAWHDSDWLASHLLGVVARLGDASWGITTRGGAQMLAEKDKSGNFDFKYITKLMSGNPKDLDIRAYENLQRTWDDRSRGLNHPLPAGLTEDQLSLLAPLLQPMEIPVDNTAQQTLASRLTSLATESKGKSVDDPSLFADERALVMDLVDATQTQVEDHAPVWDKRIAAIKSQIGRPTWNSLMPTSRDRVQ